MNRKIVNNIREQKGIALKSIIGLSIILFCACSKDNEENMQSALTVSISEHKADAKQQGVLPLPYNLIRI